MEQIHEYLLYMDYQHYIIAGAIGTLLVLWVGGYLAYQRAKTVDSRFVVSMTTYILSFVVVLPLLISYILIDIMAVKVQKEFYDTHAYEQRLIDGFELVEVIQEHPLLATVQLTNEETEPILAYVNVQEPYPDLIILERMRLSEEEEAFLQADEGKSFTNKQGQRIDAYRIVKPVTQRTSDTP